MTSFPVLALVLAAGSGPDPAALAPTPEQTARAKALATQLGSNVFREREDATRELFRMGRAALPVLADTAARTPDPEVRTRLELLMPRIEAEDLKARLAAFLADADGKFTHDLPGWDAYREVAGTTADARELFVSFWKAKENADLVAAARGPKDDLARKLAQRRMTLYNAAVRFNGNGIRVQPTVADVGALMFLEGLSKSADKRYVYAVSYLTNQPAVRDALKDEGKPALRKLLVRWLDTREDMQEVYYAMTIATNLGLKDIPTAKYAVKLIEAPANGPAAPAYYKMYALTSLARVGTKADLPVLAKALADDTATTVSAVGANNQIEQFTVQVRDVALAMSLLVAGEKPEDYGFTARTQGASDAMKYQYTHYRFEDDEKRAAALKKWDGVKAKLSAEPKKDEKK